VNGAQLVGDTLRLFDASKIHDASFEMGVSLVCSCFECGDESRRRRDEVAFRFEFTRKLADWTAEGGEVVGGEWKKEWRNLSLFRFSSLVTALAGHDQRPAPRNVWTPATIRRCPCANNLALPAGF
jgi:hypothetical protein